MTGIATLHADIRAAFRAALLTVPNLPANVIWEGREGTTTTGQPFMRESVTPIFSDPRALGMGGTIQHRILCRAQVFYPAGDGTVAVEAAAGEILAAFRPGSVLVYGGNAGTVFKAERAQILTEAAFISITVTITVTAYSAT